MLIKATSATATILIERRIRLSEVRKVIEFAEGSKDQFLNRLTGYFLTSLSLGRVRYWVEYSKKADFFLVHSAYAHGMKILEGISKHFKVNNALTDWA